MKYKVQFKEGLVKVIEADDYEVKHAVVRFVAGNQRVVATVMLDSLVYVAEDSQMTDAD